MFAESGKQYILSLMETTNKTAAANTNNNPYAIAYGAKYAATKGLCRTEIAKLIRADIKAAVKAGLLPKASYSVVCKSFAGGGSINVRIADVAQRGFKLMNPARLRWDLENPHASHHGCPSEALWQHSEEARAITDAVEKIMFAYNYDGSDSQTDYSNVRFYGHAEWSTAWERATRESETADFVTFYEGARAPKAPEPNAQELFLAAMGAV